MMKFGVSKKQTKSVGSTSTVKHMRPKIDSTNYHVILNDCDKYDVVIKLMLCFLQKHTLKLQRLLFHSSSSLSVSSPLSYPKKI